ncbi:hypothetical protein [Streptomyces sp. enrichment culture]|uniref:hypothetical protein n=1 Tax=Streptomyces sp. enrichment culture TaxID=1795815 RepID=UPI003F578093
MSSSGEEREHTSPLEQETDERDVHPEEEGRPEPDTSGGATDQTLKERAESEEGPG